jgi:metal-responsive CopG/Arc/MetJ family transcriptional regulator
MSHSSTAAKHRTHIIIPRRLASDIDRLVGKRSRSRFIADAAEWKLKNLRQLEALQGAIGSIRSEDHPEWENGSAEWVHTMRQEDERIRAKKLLISDEE